MSGITGPNLGLNVDIPDHSLWGDEGRADARRLDALVMASVKAVVANFAALPASPADGDRYLLGTGEIATWNATLATWTLYTPKVGWSAYLESTRATMRYHTAWASDAPALNVRSYGATGDGTTNDSAAVLAAITAAPAGSRLHFPTGTYLLSTWTTAYALNKQLWISGDGIGATTIKGVISTADFLKPTANFRCSDLTLDTWDIVLDFSLTAAAANTVLDNVLIEDTEIKNYRRAIYADGGAPDATTSTRGLRNLKVRSSRITTGTSYAIYLDLGITEKVHIENCTIKDCVNRAIAIGDNEITFADNRGDYVIEGNLIDGVTNGLGPPTNTAAAIGIICYGWRAKITGNTVRNVSKLDPTATDCDGIYTKCRYSVVEHNILVDAGQGESYLNIKGGARNELVVQPYGFSAIVAHNICLDTQVAPTFLDPAYTPIAVSVDAGTNVFSTSGVHGLVVGNRAVFATDTLLPGGLSSSTAYHVRTVPSSSSFTIAATAGAVADKDITSIGTGTHTVAKASAFRRTNGCKVATSDVLVVDNFFEGLTEIAIYTDSDTGASHPNHNVVISDNFIVQHRGKAAMSIYGRGNNIRVIDNLIDGVLNTWTPTSQGFGIDINKKEGVGLDIDNNRIYNVVNASNSVGVSLSPSAVDKIISADHTIDTFTATATHLGAAIAHTFSVNDRLQFTTLGTLPAGLALATWYKVESVPTINTFTLKDDVTGAHINITSNGADELTAIKQIAFASWRITDNQVDGAKYGVQFNWDPAYVTVDDVFVRHNTGRNINGNVIPVTTDLVKFSDTPTNLSYIPYNAASGVLGMTRTGTPSAPMVELDRDDAGSARPQNLKVISGDAGGGNRTWLGLETTASEHRLVSGVDGASAALPLFIKVGGTKYWRFFETDGSLRPDVDAVTDIGTSSKRVRTVHGGGGAGLAAFYGLPGDWTGGFLRLGTYRIWVDSTGKLRINNGLPSGDFDGVTVGSQT